MAIYFVTSNRFKLEEARKILGFSIKQAKVEIHEIQSMKVREIVEDKARRAYEKIKRPVIVEDGGLFIKEWKGFPGAMTKWVVKTIGISGICRLLGKNRSATAKCSVCYFDGKKLKIFSGEVQGRISGKPRGRKRFDWDRIFIPKGYKKTFAEMPLEEKNKISHRKRAFKKLGKYLKVCKGSEWQLS